MANGLFSVILNSLATMLCHQCDHHIFHCLQGYTLWQMARVAESDKLESSNLNYRIKTYNSHGPVAHSAQVPPYSTQSLISTLGTMIVPLLVNLSTLAESFHITIN